MFLVFDLCKLDSDLSVKFMLIKVLNVDLEKACATLVYFKVYHNIGLYDLCDHVRPWCISEYILILVYVTMYDPMRP